MIRLGKLVRVSAVAAVATLLLGAGDGSSARVRILTLESQRSLGAGELAQYLNGPDARLAAAAALAIGRTKAAAGEPLLRAHLHDSRVAVRALSVYGLGLLATGRDGRGLIVALDDRSGAVRVAAVDALARNRAAGALPPAVQSAARVGLEAALARDRDPIVRARAAVALLEFAKGPGRAEAARALTTAFATDRNLEVRRHAMWTIYRAYASLVNPLTIERALHDPDDVIRIEAVRAMSRLKSRALIGLVRPLLADASWRVQEQAAQTIRVLSGEPLTADWTAIPAFVHLPKRQSDPFAALPALARPSLTGKPSAPTAARAILTPQLDPTTARAMTSPAPGLHPRVRIVTTQGDVYVALFPEWAPLTVENFLDLSARGYYDRNRWFRIVPDFVVQTGDPNDNGNGDAGYTVGAEENPLEQGTGVISMGMNYSGNAPIRDSAGTQYYITLSPQYHLDRDFTVFGRVVAGFDVLARLTESDRVLRVERIADVDVR